jgi:hypothetical protein
LLLLLLLIIVIITVKIPDEEVFVGRVKRHEGAAHHNEFLFQSNQIE